MPTPNWYACGDNSPSTSRRLAVATLLDRAVFALLADEACSEVVRMAATLPPLPVEPIGGGGGGSGSFVFAPMRARTSCSSSKRACSSDMDGDLVFDRGLAASKGTMLGSVREAGRQRTQTTRWRGQRQPPGAQDGQKVLLPAWALLLAAGQRVRQKRLKSTNHGAQV